MPTSSANKPFFEGPVFVVHGIRDTAGNGQNGDWYPRVDESLWPFFEVTHIRYREYHQWLSGGIKLFAWPGVLATLPAFAALLTDWPLTVLSIIVAVLAGSNILDDWRWHARPPSNFNILLVTSFPPLLVLIGWGAQGEVGAKWASLPLLLAVGWLIARLQRAEDSFPGPPPSALHGIVYPVFIVLIGIAVCAYGTNAFLITTVIILLFSIVEPRWRIERATRKVQRQVKDCMSNKHVRASVIAHSLGTVLTRKTIWRMQATEWRWLIFVGSPLPRKLRWQPFLGAGTDHIYGIYNEAARRDIWVKAAHRTFWPLGWWTGLGGAGFKGFVRHHAEEENGLHIHDVGALLGDCGHCFNNEEPAHIHNVSIAEAHHSSALLVDDHMREAWLPFLWGFLPHDYREYLNHCLEGDQYRKVGDAEGFRQMAEVAGQLRGVWRPLPHKRTTLLEFIEDLLREHLNEPRNRPDPHFWDRHSGLYTHFFDVLFKAVASAKSSTDPKRQKNRCPQFAVRSAFEKLRR